MSGAGRTGPRRARLALLAAVVLAGHWAVLAALPLRAGGTQPGETAPLAFQTRLLPPAPPAAAAPSAPPAAAPAPAARPAPRRAAPRPRAPASSPVPVPQPLPAEAAPLPTESAALSAYPTDLLPEPGDTLLARTEPAADERPVPAGAAASQAGADAAPAPEAAVQPAAAVAPAESETAPRPAAGALADTGVEIRPPGGSGAPPLGPLPPVRLPASAQLAFEVQGQAKRLQYHASAELDWRQDGAHYEARQQIKAFLVGTRSQSSRGSITAHGLQPERFGDRFRSERAAHFDFGAGQVTFSSNAPPAPLAPGAQDRLSVFLQLGAMLAAAPERYPTGTQITLTTVGVKSADRWAFTVQGPEVLQLPIGETPALKLQRVPREGHDYDQKAELWLGTQLDYLPVRIRITQANGDFADLQLQERTTP